MDCGNGAAGVLPHEALNCEVIPLLQEWTAASPTIADPGKPGENLVDDRQVKEGGRRRHGLAFDGDGD